jgi:uncharacterized protein (UPF0276 family)
VVIVTRANPSGSSTPRCPGAIPVCAGIGLRHVHHQAVLDTPPAVGWLEVHSENYLGGGAPLHYLEAARRDYPLSLHGVGLSLGSDGALDRDHLRRIKALIRRIEPGLVSEHISWSVSGGVHFNDLLPLPYTEEALAVLCDHIAETQDFLGRQILVENPSTYLQFTHSTIPEWEFVAATAERTGCGLLLDVNNIHVSATNHGWDAHRYLATIPPDAVQEIHLAGHAVKDLGDVTLRIDDHGSAVSAEVWTLYAAALRRIGPTPTLIEWDTDIPELAVLVAEAAKADALLSAAAEGHDVAAA